MIYFNKLAEDGKSKICHVDVPATATGLIDVLTGRLSHRGMFSHLGMIKSFVKAHSHHGHCLLRSLYNLNVSFIQKHLHRNIQIMFH